MFPELPADLSWLDFSRADDLSADGRSVLLTVEGEAAGKNYEVYLRTTDGSPPVKLGEGYGSAISSRRSRSVRTELHRSVTERTRFAQLVLLPVGKGTKKILTRDAASHTTAVPGFRMRATSVLPSEVSRITTSKRGFRT